MPAQPKLVHESRFGEGNGVPSSSLRGLEPAKLLAHSTTERGKAGT
jgi:hypothetical protein